MTPSERQVRGGRLLLEAAVVVASILVAFALDAWWDGRAQARTEAAQIRALTSDFEQNAERLRDLIEREERIARYSLELLRAAVEEEPLTDEEVRSRLGNVLSSVRFDPVMGAYEAAVASGGLSGIRNDSLRLALADFAALLEGRYYERFSNELYFDFIRSFTGRLGLAEAILYPDSVPAPGPSAVRPADLLDDPKFREHLAARYVGEREVLGSYRGLLMKAEEVLELLRREAER